VIDRVATRIWSFKHGHIEDFKARTKKYLVYAQEKAYNDAAGKTRS